MSKNRIEHKCSDCGQIIKPGTIEVPETRTFECPNCTNPIFDPPEHPRRATAIDPHN